MIKLRIHHFFDILRDYGQNKELIPHHYGHSYHLIGKEIYANNLHEFKIVIDTDDICKNCNRLIDNKCIDLIDHRNDFKKKEEFNNYLDDRILRIISIDKGDIVNTEEILKKANLYLDNIFYIYKGNSEEHTKERKRKVKLGIERKIKELQIQA